MSDEADRPRVITAPLGASPARPATQMSAAAVPATLDSPKEPSVPPAAGNAPNADEIHGAELARRDAARDDAAPALDGGGVRRAGPATMMSPAVSAPLPGGSSPPLAPENAVVDVGAPAHAFMPYGSAAPGMGGGRMHHGGPGAPRSLSTTTLVLIIVGVVAAVGLLGVGVGGYLFFHRERDSNDPRAARGGGLGLPAPGAIPGDPRKPVRMGGPRAQVTVTSAGALDPEGVRAAVTLALPHLDPCFAASELEPPNHEQVGYDLDVAPSGEIRRAEPSVPGRTPKLDACMVQNLRAVRLPKSKAASAVRLTFVAPLSER